MNDKIQLVINNLEQIYQTWQGLDKKVKKQKINQILPFINLTSYLNGLSEIAGLSENSQLKNILDGFADNYQAIFDTDVTTMQSSDFSQEIRGKIEKIQSGELQVDNETRKFIADNWLKYEHAHSRVMFNYGKMLKKINESSPAEKSLQSQAAHFLNRQDQFDILAEIFAINEQFNIEQNAEAFLKDDLENHALLNQSTNYKNHLALVHLLTQDGEIENIKASLTQTPKKRITRNIETQKVATADSEKKLAEFGANLKERPEKLQLQVGIESEFLLRPFLSEAETENDKIKVALADLNARRKMEEKYGKISSIPKITDVTPFLTDQKLDEKSPRKLDIRIIQHNIANYLKTTHSPEEIAQLQKEVGRFTEAEAYFYKLLFLGEYKLPISIDGVYDSDKSKRENLENILPLIKKGKFHETLLDMIRAHEISIGPFDIAETLPKMEQSLSIMRLTANQTGLSLDDPNVQLNLSFWMNGKNVFMPEISGSGNETKMEISELGKEIMRLIGETVAESGEIPGVLRSQQFIEVNFDRKKMLPELVGTRFLEVDENQTAFTNHKKLAAKTATIRASIANKDKGVAVVETRLVGNNPHFATFSAEEELLQSGLDFIPHTLLPKIAKRIETFIDSKDKDELETLLNSKVAIGYDGKIEGLEPMIVAEIKKIDHYNPEQKHDYRPKHSLTQQGARDDINTKYDGTGTLYKPLSLKLMPEEKHKTIS